MENSNLLSLTSKVQRKKAKKFLKNESIREIGPGSLSKVRHFKCQPIFGYNVTVYDIVKFKNGFYTCSCQYHKSTKRICSHILAVSLFEEQNNLKKGE